jgi:hypothetical protein
MVAILDCGEDVVRHLARLAGRNQHLEYSEAWRWGHWQGHGTDLAVLVTDDGDIRWLGRVQASRAVTSRDRRINVTEIEAIGVLTTEQLRQRLPEAHQDTIQQRGVLAPDAGDAVVAGLRELLPNHHDLLDRLGRPRDDFLPQDSHAELLNQERDAVGVLLDIGLGGTSRRALRSWSAPPADAPFLDGLTNYPALEDHLITRDLERFGGWVEVPGARVGWRAFAEGRKRIFIMNANRTSVEQTLGVDVVYFNEARGSFVLVQYKKMRAESVGVRKELSYRPDSNLTDELERMRRIDDLCQEHPGEFRLLSTACWMKLCNPDPLIDDPAALIKGMYFAREHFEELLRTCQGPRGGTRIGYDNVPRHLNNTTFTELVADGWIGSRGPATDEISWLIRESLETGHAVVVGVQTDQTQLARSQESHTLALEL